METARLLADNRCLACRTGSPATVHAFWTSLCAHPAAARPWVTHESHVCWRCASELLLGQDPRRSLQFGRVLRHLAPIENVRLRCLSPWPARVGRAVAVAAGLVAPALFLAHFFGLL